MGRLRSAFTLVELLVVIGIIGLLIAMLLPALRKAKESAREAQCLSNLRSLAQATIMFAQENRDFMPSRAGSTTLAGQWINWKRLRDPLLGTAGAGTAADNITQSSLAKFLGARPVISSTADEANRANPRLDEIYRCPSDNLLSRPNATSDGPYRYSYTLNDFIGLPFQNPAPGAPGGSRARAYGAIYSGKLSSIKRQSDILLYACTDEKVLSGGVFKPQPTQWGTASISALASRHELKNRKSRGLTFSGDGNVTEDGRGLVSFVDGHAGFLTRKDANRQKHSWSPAPDPAGF